MQKTLTHTNTDQTQTHTQTHIQNTLSDTPTNTPTPTSRTETYTEHTDTHITLNPIGPAYIHFHTLYSKALLLDHVLPLGTGSRVCPVTTRS